jgi:fumarate hydratase subunit alpha
LCVEANRVINRDILSALEAAAGSETKPGAKNVLSLLMENAKVAVEDSLPICQDTGMAVVFVEIGQDTRVTGGGLYDAINQGVREGYETGYLRKSIVSDPIARVNTGDNTPAVIHCRIVPGSRLKITVAPKGFGSENMSAVKMLKPSDGIAGVKAFVLETVKNAGPNPCPPLIVGVGLGGTFEKCALLAKTALIRRLGERNPNEYWARFETEMLEAVNSLNIGPAGLGGRTTALAVHAEVYPTHIAGLPAAVNIGCHVTRHKEAEL